MLTQLIADIIGNNFNKDYVNGSPVYLSLGDLILNQVKAIPSQYSNYWINLGASTRREQACVIIRAKDSRMAQAIAVEHASELQWEIIDDDLMEISITAIALTDNKEDYTEEGHPPLLTTDPRYFDDKEYLDKED